MKSLKGNPFPLGNSLETFAGQDGINFALFSRNADDIELCIFNQRGTESKFKMNRTGDIWHIFITGTTAGFRYGYRVHGAGCNPNKLVLDPYAREIVGDADFSTADKTAAFSISNCIDNANVAPKNAVSAPEESFDWQNDTRPNISWHDTIIYELHVKSFTQTHPKIPNYKRGKFLGITHPEILKYFKRLGITAIELMPIQYGVDEARLQQKGMLNYWGYNVLSTFAVSPRYATRDNKPLNDFKEMVRELHKSGFEVILDMVFSHTADGAQNDPTLCQRGIDDDSYYWKDENGNYLNFSGCGNAINASNSGVMQWIIDSLKFWVEECHVDGFRFDLGAILGRTGNGEFSPESKFFKAIQNNECFKNIKFIAEPWDIGNDGYQLGKFPTPFAEWNGRFRDEIKRFFLHESGNLGEFATRFSGSSDLFSSRTASASINYIAAHDGFTLHDLVSYNHKHNYDNGEYNQDGHNDNISFNHGLEGDTEHNNILEMRQRSKQALLTALFLANGTPMIAAGDEFGNTQHGNNNAYCIDSSVTWLDWSWLGQYSSYQRQMTYFIARLIRLRKKIQKLLPRSASGESLFWTDNEVRWFNVHGEPMQLADWEDFTTKAMQIQLGEKYLLLVNGKRQAQSFTLPKIKNSKGWKPLDGTPRKTRYFQCETNGIYIFFSE